MAMPGDDTDALRGRSIQCVATTLPRAGKTRGRATVAIARTSMVLATDDSWPACTCSTSAAIESKFNTRVIRDAMAFASLANTGNHAE
jgi:hypothetical protein